jgi:hypothetical protein
MQRQIDVASAADGAFRRRHRTGNVTGVGSPEWAAETSERLLAPLGNRWRHVAAVAERARRVASVLPTNERPVLVAAAYLHDVGYAPGLQRTGAHQLDGARYLRDLGHERLACLVAHHSEARFELELRGLEDELDSYKREESVLTDALSYCDMMTGPAGERMTLEDRVAEVQRRYAEGCIVDALREALPALREAVERTEGRLRAEPDQAMTGSGRFSR